MVDTAGSGEAGYELALAGDFDLLILDVVLPEASGFELLRRLRVAGVQTPALFLTAQGEVGHRIEGLDLGADDYLAKPFAFGELLARIRAVLRRRHAEPEDGCLRVADLVLDLRARSARRGGLRIDLTPKEFQLLEYLMRNAGHAVSRTMISEKVWGYAFESYSNVIDVHMNKLRRKLGAGSRPRLIHTMKGIGYLLEDRSGEPRA